MTRRLSTIIMMLLLAFPFLMANKELPVVLDNFGKKKIDLILSYCRVSLELKEEHNAFKLYVSIENNETSEALLYFKESHGEKYLKKNKPKIEFVKTYPGSKGLRCVSGCKELDQNMLSIIPAEKSELCCLDVTNTQAITLTLPGYQAKYDPSKLLKKGQYNVDYQILAEDVLVLNIKLLTWSENDPEYMSVNDAVSKFMYSLQSAAFCNNKRHHPGVEEQQRPYKERKDSIIGVIDRILVEHSEWMAADQPHKAFTALRNKIEAANLDKFHDCGKHDVHITPAAAQVKKHDCGYCSLSEEDIYHQLDYLYQQLRNGKVTKAAAVNKANALNVCYQKSKKRKKSGPLSSKISKCYNAIVK